MSLIDRIYRNLDDLATGRVDGLVQRRRSTWDLADVGARTEGQRWVLWGLVTVMFVAALVSLALAWGAKDWVGTTAAGVVTLGAAWLLAELGTTVDPGPKMDPPAQVPHGALEDAGRER